LAGHSHLRKYQNYTAYAEGWDFYSERLGKDVGLYKDPTHYGRLEGDIWRAIRLYRHRVPTSTGPANRWLTSSMTTPTSDDTSIMPRSIATLRGPARQPLQDGQLKILELRARAKAAFGDKFDLRAFHDQVLDAGTCAGRAERSQRRMDRRAKNPPRQVAL